MKHTLTIATFLAVALLIGGCDGASGLAGSGKTKAGKGESADKGGADEGAEDGDIDITDGKTEVSSATLDSSCVKADLGVRLQAVNKTANAAANAMVAGSARTVMARQALATSLVRCTKN